MCLVTVAMQPREFMTSASDVMVMKVEHVSLKGQGLSHIEMIRQLWWLRHHEGELCLAPLHIPKTFFENDFAKSLENISFLG